MCRLRYPAILSVFLAGIFTAYFSGAPASAQWSRTLYLAVILNGAPTGKIARFHVTGSGGVLTTRDELAECGLRSRDDKPREGGLIDLSSLDGLRFRTDERTQEIFINAEDHRLRPNFYNAGQKVRASKEDESPNSSFGSVLNYTLFATTNADYRKWLSHDAHEPVLSGALEGRVFGRYGVLSQSAIANSNLAGADDMIRLDSSWSYSDPGTLRTVRAGDFITGGLSWTRPVRLGGVQVQRNFGLQPDLVTLPSPEFSGSAAVPSSIEVYANNVRVFDKDVPAGPFVISNIPVVTGAGNAQVVVNDSLGRQTVANVPFYTAPSQLRQGLYDFSVEAGVPRRSYGVRSNDYTGAVAASASVRHGVSDELTLEGHAEVSGDLLNGGAGAIFPIGTLGVMSLAAAASRDADGGTGGLFAASVESRIKGVTFYARTRRTLGGYSDLASHSTRQVKLSDGVEFYQSGPARSVDQAVIALPLGFDASRIALSYTQVEGEEGAHFRTLGLSYSRPLGRKASIYATGFKGFGDEDNHGLFAGLTLRLGDRTSSTASVSAGSGGSNGGVDVSRSEQDHPGSYGWRLRNREGDRPDRLASVSYRTRSARVQGTMQQYGDVLRASAEIDGGIVFAGRGVFLTPRIHDAFALVDAGAPGIEVYRENRLAGTTNPAGKLVVTGLNAHEPNVISIDPKNLPVDAEVARTRAIVVPGDRGGATADFGVNTSPDVARVTLRDRAGETLAVGARARLAATGKEFIVGYDGQAYLRGLSRHNTLHVALVSGASCRARFELPDTSSGQAETLEVTCL